MKILTTNIPDLKVVESDPHTDGRGSFTRLYCTQELRQILNGRHIAQVNHSRTISVGAVRGLHFQYSQFSEMKLVRCLKGRVWDVAVDLRQDSPTFLRWHAEELTLANMRMMVIPEGFAHGFQVLDPSSELLYLHTKYYTPNAEGGLRYNDPSLGIKWPLTVTDISERDSIHPYIDSNFQGLAP